MAILIGVGGAVDKVGTHGGAAAKLNVVGVDTSVNQVGSDTRASLVLVAVRSNQVPFTLETLRKPQEGSDC